MSAPIHYLLTFSLKKNVRLYQIWHKQSQENCAFASASLNSTDLTTLLAITFFMMREKL